MPHSLEHPDLAGGPPAATADPFARNARGPADAPVTLEMFGNYECLHCRRAYPEVVALVDAAGADRVRFVYHHHAPPADFPHAELAAEAAEAAAAQGAFWPMHDLLMTAAPALHPELLVAVAETAGLDVAAVRAALRDHRFRPLVEADTAHALDRGVRATPTFVVNGTPVPRGWDMSVVARAVDEALGRVGGARDG